MQTLRGNAISTKQARAVELRNNYLVVNMLITNASLITWGKNSRILKNHAVMIEGDLIADIGPSAAMVKRYPQGEEHDKALETVVRAERIFSSDESDAKSLESELKLRRRFIAG